MSEKTPKKSGMQYGRTKQKDVDKLFKVKDQEQTDDSFSAPAAGSIPDEVLGPEFAIVEPINVVLPPSPEHSETITIPIGKFIMERSSFPVSPSMVLFGKRRTGKTFSLRWILYNCFRHISFGIVFTNTSINGFWQKYVPGFLVFQGLPLYQMDRLIARQKARIAKWKEDHKGETEENPDAYKNAEELQAFVIFDDVISDRVAMQWNADINSFFVEGRHLCISVFITSQHIKGIGPMLRGNCDVVCLQPIFQKEARETIANLYAGFMPKKDFMCFMDQIVQDVNLEGSTPEHPKKYVRTLMVNDFENTRNPQVKFHWSDAENPDDIEPGWRLCSDEYWKMLETQLFSQKQKAQMSSADIVEELESVSQGF